MPAHLPPDRLPMRGRGSSLLSQCFDDGGIAALRHRQVFDAVPLIWRVWLRAGLRKTETDGVRTEILLEDRRNWNRTPYPVEDWRETVEIRKHARRPLQRPVISRGGVRFREAGAGGNRHLRLSG